MEPIPAYTEMSWGPVGTGPLSDSATVGSGGNECQYQVSVSIQQNGNSTFSGYYENRGNWSFPNIGTAPPQAFIVSLFVLDTWNNAHSFTYTGEVPSAPQPGATVQWNVTKNCPSIAQNWGPIAARNTAYAYWYNRYDESFGDWLGNLAGSVLNWFESNLPQIEQDVNTAINGVEQVLTWIAEAWSNDDDGGDGEDDVARPVTSPVSRPPLPDGVPTGAAAIAHGSSGPISGTGAA